MQKRELRRAVFGDESCIGRLPWLNTAVLVYVGVTVVSFVLLQIAPVLTWMAKTPLYHISTYLGLIGAVLMALDLFTNRGLWRGIWCWLLYGVAFMDVIASLRTMRYGVKDNLFDLCWVVIQFVQSGPAGRQGTDAPVPAGPVLCGAGHLGHCLLRGPVSISVPHRLYICRQSQ